MKELNININVNISENKIEENKKEQKENNKINSNKIKSHDKINNNKHIYDLSIIKNFLKAVFMNKAAKIFYLVNQRKKAMRKKKIKKSIKNLKQIKKKI